MYQYHLFHPSITHQVPPAALVRIGVNVHHSVAPVALDTLVSQRLGGGKNVGGVSGVRNTTSKAQLDQIRMAILEEASIVCSTLSFSGSGVFAKMAEPFDIVVIDEAAQAVEPSTLVPLTQASGLFGPAFNSSAVSRVPAAPRLTGLSKIDPLPPRHRFALHCERFFIFGCHVVCLCTTLSNCFVDVMTYLFVHQILGAWK